MDFNLPDIKRIADALEALVKCAVENHNLAKDMRDFQLQDMKTRAVHLEVFREDLEFRRAQTAKAEAVQEQLAKMFGGFGGAPTMEGHPGAGSVGAPRGISRRRRGEQQS